MHRRPNILMIICHDLGQRLGCYGVSKLRTPAIDALARQGVLLENYFATAPLCSPSRGSIMTGLYPHTNGLMGLVNRGWDMPDTYPTLAQLLRERGYTTALFGFQHEKADPHRMGYQEHHHRQGRHWCEEVSAAFISWLHARRNSEQPFFACMGFFEVHRPFKHDRYQPDDPAAVQVPGYLPEAPEVRQDLADLHGLIFAVDAAMQRILSALEAAGIGANTLVIFTTDHGIAFPRAKSTLYEAGIETALILRWRDGFAGGARYRHLLSNVDLLPTILQCAALEVPAHVQGRSFLTLLRGEPYEPHREIFAEKTWHDVYDPIRAIRTERFKYIRNFPDQHGRPPIARPRLILPVDIEQSLSRQALRRLGDPHMQARPEEELYDLDKDPNELHNVAGDPTYGPALSDLRSRLEHWMEQTADPLLKGPVPCPDPSRQEV